MAKNSKKTEASSAAITPKHVQTGQRISECMERNGYKQSKVISDTEKRTTKDGKMLKIDKSRMSKYIKGTLHVPDDVLKEIAITLHVHAGYLSGDDGFQCDTYAEYCDRKKLNENPDFLKYDALLAPAHLLLSCFVDDAEYSETHGEYIYTIVCMNEKTHKQEYRSELTSAEMEQLYNALCDQIRTHYKRVFLKEQISDIFNNKAPGRPTPRKRGKKE